MSSEVRLAAFDLDAPRPPAPDEATRDRAVRYLSSATAILFTTATAPDVYAPGRGEPVGLSVRSDGKWIWSDMITYYLREYGIVTDADLLAHVLARPPECPPLDDATAEAMVGAFLHELPAH